MKPPGLCIGEKMRLLENFPGLKKGAKMKMSILSLMVFQSLFGLKVAMAEPACVKFKVLHVPGTPQEDENKQYAYIIQKTLIGAGQGGSDLGQESFYTVYLPKYYSKADQLKPEFQDAVAKIISKNLDAEQVNNNKAGNNLVIKPFSNSHPFTVRKAPKNDKEFSLQFKKANKKYLDALTLKCNRSELQQNAEAGSPDTAT